MRKKKKCPSLLLNKAFQITKRKEPRDQKTKNKEKTKVYNNEKKNCNEVCKQGQFRYSMSWKMGRLIRLIITPDMVL